MKKTTSWSAVILLICGLMIGCGGGYGTAPVTGVVTLDGEPLGGAVVTFTPKPKGEQTIVGPFSYGRTDNSGKFELQLRRNQGVGAVIGSHSIQVEFPDYDPGSIAETEAAISEAKRNNEDTAKLQADLDRMKKAGKIKIPAKYVENSPLTVEVPSGGLSDYEVKLVSD